ncbi:SNF2-related protein [Metarhizium rileyi]|uniref:SNF2-related protein n=1 Tax=Metarhizium rileyi (strain RCEF 4871) TaxID=1649241 RepID=A0A167JQC8_METRR|nr:SNF2-related protein [Metarhizium rileyi RCEF 4871]
MTSHDRQKPGAGFAFKPENNIPSRHRPDFPNSSSQRPTQKCLAQAFADQNTGDAVSALRDISTMVNERQPPKEEKGSNAKREQSPDDFDAVFDRLHGFGSIKPQYTQGVDLPGLAGSTSTVHASSGHPMKMVSSRKQKADIFVHQKSRPEHHLGGTTMSGPRPPAYQDRKPPPLPVFHSNGPEKPRTTYADQVFYTDPTKASEDLKALLEGGMEDDDDEESQNTEKSQPSQSQSQSKDSLGEEAPPPSSKAKRESPVGKDGTIVGLKVKLLPHQVEGVEWMRGRELGPVKRGRVPKGGLLADDMGLGKTLQSVSLIITNQKPQKDGPGWKKHFESLEKTTLVVAPLALIRQWEHEIKDKVQESHGLKVLVHHGPQRTKDFKQLALYDVVITTFQILVSEHGASSDAEDGVKKGCFGLRWWRIILDEAHSIKNRNAKATKACYALRCEYRWCLSGTPMQNNLDELQSLVKFLRISPYDDLKQWREHIDQPMKNGKGHIAIRRLHSLLPCFMKRRTKEILKKDGALNPGGKPSGAGEPSTTGFRHTERKVVTIYAKLPPAERKFYDRLEARADKSMEVMMRNKLSYASAFTLLLRLRQACNHPKLVEGKLEKDKDAISTGSSQKSQDIDMNAVADMFAGMGIVTKSCSICGRELTLDDTTLNRDNCAECHDDLEYFKNHEKLQTQKPKRSRRKKNRKSKGKEPAEDKAGDAEVPKQGARRPRNRNAIIDSDDEEEKDASWLVPEGERGNVHFGKAGGEEDENAEGGGDWIGAEDSEDDTDDKDGSNLSSFVVDDDTAKKDDGHQSVDEAAQNDSLLSVDALTQAMASQTLEDEKPKPAASTSDAGSTSGDDEEDSESDYSSSSSSSGDDEDNNEWLRSGKQTQVLASAKIREVTKILQAEAKQHKFIVFSQFTSMLDLVEPFLDKDGFEYVRYDGSMKNDDREESLRSLREDESTRILLCSLKCGSLGLNLTAATRVIIIEPFWNPFVEEQAIDRVHRLTQTVDVVVYKLTVADSVEERIVDLQNKKRELAEQTIEGGARKEAMKLGLSEMIDLFRPGNHHQDVPPGPLEDRRMPAERNAGVLRRKPVREESAVFGRRW